MDNKITFEKVEVIKDGDVVSWIKGRWKQQGITQQQINDAFGALND